jgi:eukaryotic-like serine/threonine-protein kinase
MTEQHPVPSEMDTPALDPALELMLAELDAAMLAGGPTEQLERSLADRFGAQTSETVAMLKALHAAGSQGHAARSEQGDTWTMSQQSTWTGPLIEGSPWQFGRFEQLDRIGAGASGVVYRARDPQLRRLVALKVARGETLFSKEARQRFMREARVLASLRHTNIIPVYETGETDGLPYIVQELCDGPNLAAWLRRRSEDLDPVPILVAARWVMLMAQAVGHAHELGIVHRDLKPANVLLQPDVRRQSNAADNDLAADDYEPRITDFGIAKLFGSDDEAVTATVAVLGTAAYMAPEQAEGKTREVGPSADVYSLGVILYELLAGRRPIDGGTDIEILRRVSTDEPIPVRHIRREVPIDLEAICIKCLDKDPSRRYSTASGLASDLNHFLRGEPVAVRPESPLALRVRKLGRRQFSSRTVLVGTLAASVAIAAVGGISWQTRLEHVAAVALLEQKKQQDAEAFRRAYPDDIRQAYHLLERTAGKVIDRGAMAREAVRILARYIPEVGRPDLRGFEWHYLWKVLHPKAVEPKFNQRRAIRAHNRPAYVVSFSPDGRRLASGSSDMTARLWDVETGHLLFTLVGHTNEVNDVEFSPDGKTLATASEDGTLRLWDALTGAPREILWRHTHEVTEVAFNPANGQIAAASDNGVLKVWDLASRREIATINAHAGKRIEALAFSPDGSRAATAGADNRVRVWNVGGPYSRVAEYQGWQSQAVAFSHDGELLAAGNRGEALIFRIATGELLTHVLLPGPHIRSLRFTLDDSSLIAAGDERTASLIDLTTGEFWNPFGTGGTIWCAACSSDGRRVATADSEGTLRVWDCSARRNFHRVALEVRQGVPTAFAMSPDGKRIAMGSGPPEVHLIDKNGELSVWDISGSRPNLMRSTELDAPNIWLSGITFTPDSSAVVYSKWVNDVNAKWDNAHHPDSGLGQLRTLDIASGVERCAIAERSPLPGVSHLNVDARILVSIFRESGGRPPGYFQFREYPSGRVLDTISFRTSEQRLSSQVCLSPVEDIFATDNAESEHRIAIFRTSDRKRLATWPKRFDEGLQSLQFTRDGRLLIAYQGWGHIVFLNRQNGKVTREFTVPGLHGNSRAAALSPDGRAVALSSMFGIVLADTDNGQAMCTLAFPRPMIDVIQLAFASDGRTIAADGCDSERRWGVYLWQIDEDSEEDVKGVAGY